MTLEDLRSKVKAAYFDYLDNTGAPDVNMFIDRFNEALKNYRDYKEKLNE